MTDSGQVLAGKVALVTGGGRGDWAGDRYGFCRGRGGGLLRGADAVGD